MADYNNELRDFVDECKYCGAPIDADGVDASGGDACSGNDDLENENEPHVAAETSGDEYKYCDDAPEWLACDGKAHYWSVWDEDLKQNVPQEGRCPHREDNEALERAEQDAGQPLFSGGPAGADEDFDDEDDDDADDEGPPTWWCFRCREPFEAWPGEDDLEPLCLGCRRRDQVQRQD